MMTPATSNEIATLVGEVDTFTIERILETHASADEIAEALADIEDERRFGDQREPTTRRVAEVRAILEELAEEDDEAYVS